MLAKTLATGAGSTVGWVMKQGLSMETRQELVGGFAVEYAKGTKWQKGVVLGYLCVAIGWSRANARRRLAAEARNLTLRSLPRSQFFESLSIHMEAMWRIRDLSQIHGRWPAKAKHPKTPVIMGLMGCSQELNWSLLPDSNR